VHLWFDREITDLTHAALLDTTIQWLYNKSKIQQGTGGYVELVISASRSLVSMQRQQIIDLAMRELAGFFPEVKRAKLLKAAVTKEVRATYSIRPGLDRIRPTSKSPWPGIYLAGYCTATGWPSTMGSGVRCGYLAAETITSDSGEARKFLVPDLPPTGLMRFVK
jgi:zeta-carotene desaturase